MQFLRRSINQDLLKLKWTEWGGAAGNPLDVRLDSRPYPGFLRRQVNDFSQTLHGEDCGLAIAGVEV